MVVSYGRFHYRHNRVIALHPLCRTCKQLRNESLPVFQAGATSSVRKILADVEDFDFAGLLSFIQRLEAPSPLYIDIVIKITDHRKVQSNMESMAAWDEATDNGRLAAPETNCLYRVYFASLLAALRSRRNVLDILETRSRRPWDLAGFLMWEMERDGLLTEVLVVTVRWAFGFSAGDM